MFSPLLRPACALALLASLSAAPALAGPFYGDAAGLEFLTGDFAAQAGEHRAPALGASAEEPLRIQLPASQAPLGAGLARDASVLTIHGHDELPESMPRPEDFEPVSETIVPLQQLSRAELTSNP